MDSAREGSRAQSLRRGFAPTGGSVAEAAALYARGDVAAFIPNEGDRSCWPGERERLIEWAKQNGLLEISTPLDPHSAPARGTEQLVYPDGDRLHKYFYVDVRLEKARQMEQGMFGWIHQGKLTEIKTRPASPAEAMARIAWFNRLYPEAMIEVEGIDENGRIHTSQPFVAGRLPVSFDDLVRAMRSEGWEPYFAAPEDTSTSAFYHPEADAYLADVHGANGMIRMGTDGTNRFQPFDVVPIVPSQHDG